MPACEADQQFTQQVQPKRGACSMTAALKLPAQALQPVSMVLDHRGSCCRFLVPEEKLEHFQAAWADRAAHMKQFPGFREFNISQQSDGTWLTVSRCAAAPEVSTGLESSNVCCITQIVSCRAHGVLLHADGRPSRSGRPTH